MWLSAGHFYNPKNILDFCSRITSNYSIISTFWVLLWTFPSGTRDAFGLRLIFPLCWWKSFLSTVTSVLCKTTFSALDVGITLFWALCEIWALSSLIPSVFLTLDWLGQNSTQLNTWGGGGRKGFCVSGVRFWNAFLSSPFTVTLAALASPDLWFCPLILGDHWALHSPTRPQQEQT